MWTIQRSIQSFQRGSTKQRSQWINFQRWSHRAIIVDRLIQSCLIPGMCWCSGNLVKGSGSVTGSGGCWRWNPMPAWCKILGREFRWSGGSRPFWIPRNNIDSRRIKTTVELENFGVLAESDLANSKSSSKFPFGMMTLRSMMFHHKSEHPKWRKLVCWS